MGRVPLDDGKAQREKKAGSGQEKVMGSFHKY